MIQSVAYVVLSERLSQLSHKVAVGPRVQRIPVPGHRRPPVGEALVVLRGQHHIPGTGPLEEPGPLMGLEVVGGEMGREVRVGGGGREPLLHEALVVGAVLPLPVPPEPLGAPGGDGEHAPVHEHPHLRLVEPSGQRPCVQAGPVWAVARRGEPRPQRG